jgi:protein-tyrosine-phosphatase
MIRILCVCTGNICRSPMLEVLVADAAARAGVAVAVASAGVDAVDGLPASDHAVTCMAERGLDLRRHRSRSLAGLDLAAYDQIWCMGPGHAADLRTAGAPVDRIHLVDAAHGGVPDPYGGDLADYLVIADLLAVAATDIVAALGRHR